VRLATVSHAGATAAARVAGDEVTLLPEPDLGALLARADWRERAATARGAAVARDDVRFAPTIPSPRKILCAGLNYRSHIAETGRPAPTHPFFFPKFDNSLIGAYDDLPLPAISATVDWEAELTIVIGAPARRVAESEALRHVAGYTVMNDVSVREWQRHGPTWTAGKAFEGMTPVGPVLLTSDELPDGEPDLLITCSVDDTEVQRARTSDLLFGVAELVAYLSQVMTLLPGDLIATGTPSGIGSTRTPPRFLKPAELLRTEIEGIGELANRCVEEVPAQW
jgi:acylpyruvate hydrolase